MIVVAKNIKSIPESLNVALEEIRIMFQHEQDRFQKIESKATAFLTLNSILFTALSFILIIKEYSVFIPTIIFFGLGIFFSFKVYGLKFGRKPHKEYGDWYQYTKLTKPELEDQFLLDYMEANKKEEKINNEKIEYLKSIVFFSKLAWLFFIIGSIILIFARFN